MPTFELQLAEEFTGKLPVYYLCKNGVRLTDEFFDDPKQGNFKKEFLKLWRIIEMAITGYDLSEEQLKQIKVHSYENIYEARSKHLRLYVLYNKNENIVAIIAGRKIAQKADIKWIKDNIKNILNDITFVLSVNNNLNKRPPLF